MGRAPVTCYRNDQVQGRLLVGRHLDPCRSPGDCHGCWPCEEHHCATCHRVHAPDVCPGCLALVRIDLHAIGGMWVRLPVEATNGRPAYHTHVLGIPGGEATVMLAPGHYTLKLYDPPVRYDPPPIVVLDHWAIHWSGVLGHRPVHIADPVMASLVTYLDGVLHQVTGDPEFLVMAHDLAKTVRRMEDVLHDGDRPERSRVPCWECGTRLVKVYTSKVKDDHWLCPRCGELYDAGRYERAKHDHLASSGANRYVSVSDATVAIGRPVQTVRSWIRRGLIDTARDPSTGRLTAWWPDVRNQHLATAPRPKAG